MVPWIVAVSLPVVAARLRSLASMTPAVVAWRQMLVTCTRVCIDREITLMQWPGKVHAIVFSQAVSDNLPSAPFTAQHLSARYTAHLSRWRRASNEMLHSDQLSGFDVSSRCSQRVAACFVDTADCTH